jgi:hypothetical protein
MPHKIITTTTTIIIIIINAQILTKVSAVTKERGNSNSFEQMAPVLGWRGGESPFIYLFIYLNSLKYNINIRLSTAGQPVLSGGRHSQASPAPEPGARPQRSEVSEGLQDYNLPEVSMAPRGNFISIAIKNLINKKQPRPKKKKKPAGERLAQAAAGASQSSASRPRRWQRGYPAGSGRTVYLRGSRWRFLF